MSDEVFEIEYRTTGAQEARREGESLQAVNQRLASTSQTVAAQTTRQAQSFDALKTVQQQLTSAVRDGLQSWSALGTAAGQAGAAIGRLGPAFQGLGTVMGSAGQSIQQVINALASPSPASLVSAVVSVSSTLVDGITAWNDYRRAQDAAARSARQTASAIVRARSARDARTALESQHAPEDLDIATAAVQGRRLELARATSAVNALRSDGSIDAFRRAEAARAAAQHALERALSEEHTISAELEHQAALRANAASDERDLARWREQNARDIEEQNAILEEAGLGGSRRGGGRGSDGYQESMQRSLQEEIRYRQQLSAQWEEMYGADAIAAAERRASEFAENRLRDSREQLEMGDWIVRKTEEQTAALERQRAQYAKNAEADAESKANLLARAQATKDHNEELAQITNDAWSSVGSSITGFMGDVFRYIAEGNELTGEGFLRLLDQFLTATATEYTVKSLIEVGETVAAYARYDYSAGSQHASAAALFGAVATLAGAGALAISPPSGTQNGGPRNVEPAQGSAGVSQSTTVVINSPNALWTQRERGELIAQSVREARRQGGPQAARF